MWYAVRVIIQGGCIKKTQYKPNAVVRNFGLRTAVPVLCNKKENNITLKLSTLEALFCIFLPSEDRLHFGWHCVYNSLSNNSFHFCGGIRWRVVKNFRTTFHITGFLLTRTTMRIFPILALWSTLNLLPATFLLFLKCLAYKLEYKWFISWYERCSSQQLSKKGVYDFFLGQYTKLHEDNFPKEFSFATTLNTVTVIRERKISRLSWWKLCEEIFAALKRTLGNEISLITWIQR